MKLSADSPELTAYALGELDPAERAAVEAALAEAPELRAELAALRDTADTLAAEFAAEPAMELSPDQRAAIVRSAGSLPAAAASSVAASDNPEAYFAEEAAAAKMAARRRVASPTLLERFLAWRAQLVWATAAACAAMLTFFVWRPVGSGTEQRDELAETLRYQPGRLALADAPATELEAKEKQVLLSTATTSTTDLTSASSVATKPAAAPADLTALSVADTKTAGAAPTPVRPAVSATKSSPAPKPAPAAAPPGQDRLAETEQLWAAATPPTATAPADRSRMDPALARRYAMTAPASANGPAAASPPQMDPVLAKRYGLAPQKLAPSNPTPDAGSAGVVEASRQRNDQLALGREAKFRTLAEVDDYSRDKAEQLGRTLKTDFVRERGLVRLQQQPLSEQRGELFYNFRELGGRSSNEAYAPVTDNPFKDVTAAPLSTFGMDVDTGSYSNLRRFLRDGSLPPPDAVRLEELINYFRYDYPQPRGDDPFSATVEVAACPWSETHKLVRVGVKAKDLARGERPRANLVFLLDVSGSMEPENKLPLVKRSLRLLLDKLTPRDTVGIVTYAGEARVALEPIVLTAAGKQRATDVLESLRAGSGTHGSAGIQNAYAIATNHFFKEGVNRVILCTDGDFNIGVTDRGELLSLITEKAKSGVFLSVLGFGMGNLKDATMETLADKGNGNYAYLDSFSEARKVLVEQLDGTLVTVAKDAKVQVEFNPARVASYRLLGYEKRLLRDRDFNDDTKDAGEVGAGHSVTVLYEIIPAGPSLAGVDPLRYAGKKADEAVSAAKVQQPVHTDELLNLKLRYKQPDGDQSRLIEHPVKDGDREFAQAGSDFKFTAAVAGYGMLLRNSPHKGDLTWEKVLRLAEQGLGDDKEGYRAEFIDLARTAQKLSGGK